jgi:hypothetical protein
MRTTHVSAFNDDDDEKLLHGDLERASRARHQGTHQKNDDPDPWHVSFPAEEVAHPQRDGEVVMFFNYREPREKD